MAGSAVVPFYLGDPAAFSHGHGGCSSTRKSVVGQWALVDHAHNSYRPPFAMRIPSSNLAPGRTSQLPVTETSTSCTRERCSNTRPSLPSSAANFPPGTGRHLAAVKLGSHSSGDDTALLKLWGIHVALGVLPKSL